MRLLANISITQGLWLRIARRRRKSTLNSDSGSLLLSLTYYQVILFYQFMILLHTDYDNLYCVNAQGLDDFCVELVVTGQCNMENLDHHRNCARACDFCPRYRMLPAVSSSFLLQSPGQTGQYWSWYR